MILKVDKEANILIEQLCDLALKNAGIKNLKPVNEMLNAIELIEKQESEDKKEE